MFGLVSLAYVDKVEKQRRDEDRGASSAYLPVCEEVNRSTWMVYEHMDVVEHLDLLIWPIIDHRSMIVKDPIPQELRKDDDLPDPSGECTLWSGSMVFPERKIWGYLS